MENNLFKKTEKNSQTSIILLISPTSNNMSWTTKWEDDTEDMSWKPPHIRGPRQGERGSSITSQNKNLLMLGHNLYLASAAGDMTKNCDIDSCYVKLKIWVLQLKG